MRLLGAILDKVISVGVIVLIILFQDEIRRFLLALGSHKGWKFLSKLFGKHQDNGEMFNADVNARLIENIFFKNSPLHDGAMIIAKNRIRAAGCILPVAQTANLPKEMGLRHRSGLGMSFETDALVIIVSEERGKISVAHNGNLSVNISGEELQQILCGERQVTNYC